ncbi:hypothetical protein KP509_22G001700 [Ceratopteris richardii]|uniref:ADP-ribosyl cyclase/cyclic ADP-ribose hydrolase n=1 Tax=Ceratopteris richardii TaxID=49495 RepID=A0A8T2S4Q9_CERRI|nr:hypothetical protein KP509_22G001700 [Ceratopteris richardii]
MDSISYRITVVSEICVIPARLESSEKKMRSRRDTDSSTYYQVICHRGTDTKRGFVNVLHKELKSKGIISFVDYEMEDGSEVELCIQKALENSRVFIVVLSPGFASSKWCLKEVGEIMRIYRSYGSSETGQKLLLLPVFFDVEPSEVRYQKKASRYDLSRVKRSCTAVDREQWSRDVYDLSLVKGIE